MPREVCKIDQLRNRQRCILAELSTAAGVKLKALGPTIEILKVEKDHPDGILVTFSDGTTAGYVVEELLTLRPIRERVEEPLKSDSPTPPM